MARRLVEISSEPAILSAKDGQFLIGRSDDPEGRLHLATVEAMRRRIPCEDIGLVVVDHPETQYAHSALCALAENGAALVICDRRHLPTAVLLPLSTHREQVWRIDDQIRARNRKPLIKQLWTAIVRAKIVAQADNLLRDDPVRDRMIDLANRVKSGDPENAEAQAARLYWPRLFLTAGRVGSSFKRLPGERTAPNSFLDYGYAILRAGVARALVGAGLMPLLGIHHRNRSNAFCLADDLVEPLRPLVDRAARRLVEQGAEHLDRPAKSELLLVLNETVSMSGSGTVTTGPLQAALPRYAATLAQSFADSRPSLEIPTPHFGPPATDG